MQNKSKQVTKRIFLWFNNHTTILPANGYKHYPFKVKSDCFPHMKTSCQNHHIPHCSAKLLTTHRRQSCWGGKGGTGWSEEKRGTLHMQNKSGAGLCAGSLWNHTPVHATWGWGPWYNYIETDNPVTLSIPRETETKTKNQRSRGEKGWWQRDRNQGISVLQTGKWDSKEWVSEQKTQFMALGMKLPVSFSSVQEENEMDKKSVEPGLLWYFLPSFGKSA